MSKSRLSVDDFALRIIEGPRGLNVYEDSEVVSWPYSDRVAASVWTMRCLSNPGCKGSDVAIKTILARRKKLQQVVEPKVEYLNAQWPKDDDEMGDW